MIHIPGGKGNPMYSKEKSPEFMENMKRDRSGKLEL